MEYRVRKEGVDSLRKEKKKITKENGEELRTRKKQRIIRLEWVVGLGRERLK